VVTWERCGGGRGKRKEKTTWAKDGGRVTLQNHKVRRIKGGGGRVGVVKKRSKRKGREVLGKRGEGESGVLRGSRSV